LSVNDRTKRPSHDFFLMEKLKEYFIDKPVETILDVATGQGQFLRILSDFFPNAKITGIDPDAASLKIAINEHINDTLTPAQENQKFYHHLKSYTDRLNGHFHRETWAKQEILDIIKENGIHFESVFEYSDGRNIITQTRPVEFWTDQLKKHIEILKHKPVYKELLPKLKEFKQRIEKDGMQQVNNVVVIGRITKQPD